MWFSSIQLKNVRGFQDSGKINLSKNINLLVGPNNSGKSTIIKSFLGLQYPKVLQQKDVRNHENGNGEILIGFKDPERPYLEPQFYYSHVWEPILRYYLSLGTLFIRPAGGNSQNVIPHFSASEPKNFIYPFLSGRKATELLEDVRLQNTTNVLTNFTVLNSKIDRISNPLYPNNAEYMALCKDILDLSITSFSSSNGKKSGIIVDTFKNISIESMGEGVINLVALIENLCIAKGKLFLIEEPENDIHPKALKKLLKVIIDKSEHNQFIISTHSNIVTKYLGAEKETKIFNVTMEMLGDRLPTSTVKEIENTKEERIRILTDLGYELWDFDVWKGWLILEESSAERIIRDYLIPWFVPGLVGKLRTVSANGTSKLEASFEDFRRLFSFIHLENAYKDRAWVIADGDKEAVRIITELKKKFPTWSENNFLNFSRNNFEEYYPAMFQAKVSEILKMESKQQRQEAKKNLLNEVLKWIQTNQDTAKNEFSKSAAEVINILSKIML